MGAGPLELPGLLVVLDMSVIEVAVGEISVLGRPAVFGDQSGSHCQFVQGAVAAIGAAGEPGGEERVDL
jgi:hypothetical protein